MDWTHLAQGRVQWLDLVSMLMDVSTQVLTATSMKLAVFWYVAPCSMVDIF
jgi:hypothetical protein